MIYRRPFYSSSNESPAVAWRAFCAAAKAKGDSFLASALDVTALDDVSYASAPLRVLTAVEVAACAESLTPRKMASGRPDDLPEEAFVPHVGVSIDRDDFDLTIIFDDASVSIHFDRPTKCGQFTIDTNARTCPRVVAAKAVMDGAWGMEVEDE